MSMGITVDNSSNIYVTGYTDGGLDTNTNSGRNDAFIIKYNSSKGKVCPYCGQSSQTVFVHGHEQCVVCKTNVEPCCSGEFIKNGKLEEVGKLFGGKK